VVGVTSVDTLGATSVEIIGISVLLGKPSPLPLVEGSIGSASIKVVVPVPSTEVSADSTGRLDDTLVMIGSGVEMTEVASSGIRDEESTCDSNEAETIVGISD
jgi:hypothetical protein